MTKKIAKATVITITRQQWHSIITDFHNLKIHKNNRKFNDDNWKMCYNRAILEILILLS